MLAAIWNELGTASRVLLIGCAAVIPIAAGILIVDRLFIREPPPPLQEVLPEVAARLGMTVDVDERERDRLLALLRRFEAIAGQVSSVESVLWREDATHRLHVFEFKASEVVMVTSNPIAPLRRHRAGITRLAIVVELKGAMLPEWTVLGAGELPTPPWTAAAAERAQRIDDLWLGTGGPFVVAVARPDRFPLNELVGRHFSPDFHPGLLNSALAVDVQRVLDVTDRLDTGAPPLARVYRIDGIEVKLPEVRRPNLSGTLPARRSDDGSPPPTLEELGDRFEARVAAQNRKAAERQVQDEARRATQQAARETQAEARAEAFARRRAEADARRQALDEALLQRVQATGVGTADASDSSTEGDPR